MKKYAITTIVVVQKYLRGLIKYQNTTQEKNHLKKQFAIYLDLECTLKTYNLFKTTQKNLIQKKARHEPSGWSMFIGCSFDKKENKLNYHRAKVVLKNYVQNEKKVQQK